MCCRLNCL